MVDTFPCPFVTRCHLFDDTLFTNDVGHLAVKSSLTESKSVDFLGLIVTPMVTQPEQVEVMSLTVLHHLLVKWLVAHEHVSPDVCGGSFLALW